MSKEIMKRKWIVILMKNNINESNNESNDENNVMKLMKK